MHSPGKAFVNSANKSDFGGLGFFTSPFYMSLVLVKVSPGRETFHGYCGKGKAGEAVQRKLLQQQRLGYNEHLF